MTPEVKALVDKAKSEGHRVYSVVIAGEKYIYRSINRKEFREMQEIMTGEAETARLASAKKREELMKNNPDLTENSQEIVKLDYDLEKEAMDIKDKAEDKLVAVSLIHPVGVSENLPAGVVNNLAEKIMEGSGFQATEEPEIL